MTLAPRVSDTYTGPMASPDTFAPITTTLPRRLTAAARARASAAGHPSLAAYLTALIRADLAGAGLDVPPPPPPKWNGPKPRRNAGKVRGEKKDRAGS